MMTINGLSRLKKQIVDAGVPIIGLSTKGIVTPTELQKQAQSIIDAFDGSPEADEKYREQQKYENANNALALSSDQSAVLIKATLDVLVKEIKAAAPAYIVPDTAALVAKVQAVIDASKPK